MAWPPVTHQDVQDAVTALQSTAAIARRGALTIVLGDSIDAGADLDDYYSAGSVFSDLCILSGQKVKWLRNSGNPGDTTAAVLARVYTEAINLSPGIVIIGGGVTNDHGAGVAEATTRANLSAMVDALRTAGITVAARTTTPVDVVGSGAYSTLATRRAAVQRHNAWLQAWCAARSIPVLDYFTPVVDETTGGYATSMSDDGTHPNIAAQLTIANYVIGQGLSPIFDGRPLLASAVGGSPDLLNGTGLFLGTPTSGLAAGWTASGSAATFAVETDTAVPGSWQHISGVASGNAVVQAPDNHLTGFAPGDTLEFAGRVEKSGTGDAFIRLRIGDDVAWNYEVSPVAGVRVISGIFAGRMTLPAGQTWLEVQMVVNAGASLRVSQVTVSNLTALGVA